MGDPSKLRKKYTTPSNPWNSEQIAEEKELLKEYGLKNKKEIWKMEHVVKNAKAQAKLLSRTDSDQARIEETELLEKLTNLGILDGGSSLDNILALTIRNVLERRLQTRVYKKMLANSMKQARQFITHGHVTVNGKCITSPAFIVSLKDDASVEFHADCSLSNPEHPERVAAKKETPEEVEVLAKAKDAKATAEKEAKEAKAEDVKAAKEKKAEDAKEAKAKVEEKVEEAKAEPVAEKAEEVKEEPKAEESAKTE